MRATIHDPNPSLLGAGGWNQIDAAFQELESEFISSARVMRGIHTWVNHDVF